MTTPHRIALRGAAGALAVLPLAGCSLPGSQAAPDASGGESCTVAKVVDGDTIWADCGQGRADKLRLIGLDTPETRHPTKGVQCYGPEASQRAHQLLDGQRVTLKPDPTQDTSDKYDRRLVYIFLPDGTLYEKKMIAEGYGREYTYKTRYQAQSELRAAQKDAEKHGRGLWSACKN